MTRARIEAALNALWYGGREPPAWLRAFSRLYGRVAARRAARARGQRVGLPVLVIGNITVGGTGKTPLCIAVVEVAREMGLRPGVVSRGYGGRASEGVLMVRTDTDPALSGDEPLLIARRTGVPVAVCARRFEAARYLADLGEVDLVIADDGLQHHALGRDAEICVLDAARGFGNGWLLPAGPLREPISRLERCDLLVLNGEQAPPDDLPAALARADRLLRMRLVMNHARPLVGGTPRPLADFAGRPVHAVAGIGNPDRFFAGLRAAGLEPRPHAFPDHHALKPEDLDFGDDLPVLMTEKDAVKLATADARCWSVPVDAHFDAAGLAAVRNLLARLTDTPS